jgi:hypothetical protein
LAGLTNFLLRGSESDGLFFLSDWIFLVFLWTFRFFLRSWILGFSIGSDNYRSWTLVFCRFGFVGFLDLDIVFRDIGLFQHYKDEKQGVGKRISSIKKSFFSINGQNSSIE